MNYYLLANKFTNESKLCHHGILGMKWGIRRYQNKDGSLTPAGRARLGLSEYDKDYGSDIVLKKGTNATRVVSTNQYTEYADPVYGGSPKEGKKYVDSIKSKENTYDRKYMSIDDVRNSGRSRGSDFYLGWFTEGGASAKRHLCVNV